MKTKERDLGLLVILAVVVILLSTSLVAVIQFGKSERDIGTSVGNAISGIKYFELFSDDVLTKYAPRETSGEAIVRGSNGFEMAVNYDKQTFTVDGREMPFIVDEIVDGDGNIVETPDLKSATSWVHLPYNRFDVYIDQDYYNANTPEINDFFDDFESRYELMESTTGWSSEQFYGVKLQINVTGITSGCWGGASYPGYSYLYLSNPLYKPGCARSEISPTLGEWWFYMSGALHESLHSINPLPLLYRDWLTEGWSEYNQYNILSQNGDITQSTADDYLHEGMFRPSYNWQGYVANDYRDTTVSNDEIQESRGYDITAWMFSMMRNDYSMDFADYYDLLDSNYETLDEADSMWETSDYFTDMVVIDLFGRSVGYDFAQIKDVWEYVSGSPEQGPDWGVRQWVDTSWYADLVPVLSFSKSDPAEGQSVTLFANIQNNGNVSLEGVSVKFYEGSNFIAEKIVNVDAQSGAVASVGGFTRPEGSYTIYVRADEDNVKIESNEFNNEDSAPLSFEPAVCGDINGDGVGPFVDDLSYLIDFLFKGGAEPPNMWAANVDGITGSGGPVDVTDLSYLVDYLFREGLEPICGEI